MNAKSIDAHVGGRLRRQRLLAGMSQEELANRLGLTFQQIQKYEKGRNRMGAGRLYELAKIFNVKVQFFFEDIAVSEDADANVTAGSAEPSSDYGLVEFINSREAVELNRAFLRIENPESRRAVLKLMRSLATD